MATPRPQRKTTPQTRSTSSTTSQTASPTPSPTPITPISDRQRPDTTISKKPNKDNHNKNRYAPVDSAFQVKKLKNANLSNLPYCEGEHFVPHTKTKGSKKGTPFRKIASYRVTILDRDIFLCPQCTKEWQKVWASALSPRNDIDPTA